MSDLTQKVADWEFRLKLETFDVSSGGVLEFREKGTTLAQALGRVINQVKDRLSREAAVEFVSVKCWDKRMVDGEVALMESRVI